MRETQRQKTPTDAKPTTPAAVDFARLKAWDDLQHRQLHGIEPEEAPPSETASAATAQWERLEARARGAIDSGVEW